MRTNKSSIAADMNISDFSGFLFVSLISHYVREKQRLDFPPARLAFAFFSSSEKISISMWRLNLSKAKKSQQHTPN